MSKVLSVSIAAYNVSEYLEETLDSIVDASDVLDCLEVIVVNDGSRDETSQIAHEYASRYPQMVIVVDKENGGYGSTINASLKIATGKYYKLLDGDDSFDGLSLISFIRYLTLCEADLVVSPYYEVTTERKLVDLHADIPSTATPFGEFKTDNVHFAMHELAIKTEVLRSYGAQICEKCFYTDTEYVMYCLAAAQSIARFSNPVYCYRLGIEGQSVSLVGIRKHYADFTTVGKRIFGAYEKNQHEASDGKKEILSHIVLHYTYNTYKAFMLLEKPTKEKRRLKQFDSMVRESFPSAYAIGNNSKLVHTLRKTHFLGYRLMSKMTLRAYRAESQ